MNRSYTKHFLTSMLILLTVFLSLFLPDRAQAAEILVPQDYALIQDAITAATAGDIIMVAPGTYHEALTLVDGVELRGQEAARTFLTGDGSGPIVSVSGTVGTVIDNFTFINATIGIQVSGNSSVLEISNNIFEIGGTASNNAIMVLNSPSTKIINNTFYNNGTAVNRDADIDIINNLFANSQAIAISAPTVAASKIRYNLFWSNVSTGPTGTQSVSGDPLFVDPVLHDFHVKEGSPSIDKGDPTIGLDVIDDTRSDIGAYGGQFADPIPFPVAGLSVLGTTGTSIDLSWSPNYSYLVTNTTGTTGGYMLYYGYAPGVYDGTDAENSTYPSPIDVGPYETFTIMDLDPLARVPSAPVLEQAVASDGKLALTWNTVTGAAGYKVHYGRSSTGEHTIDAGNVTTYTLNNLTNGQPYRIAVSAYAPATYYIAVAAYDGTSAFHESAPSPEVAVQLGPALESALSNVQIDYADAVAPFPALGGSGGRCFLATSAYGSYSAPEVLVLRVFRDRYLLTTSAGRSFVRWYYRYGAVAAGYVDMHPAYKPLVRAALLPVVGAAYLLTNPGALFVFCALLIASTITFLRARKVRELKRSIILMALMLLPMQSSAEEPILDHARWSLEVKRGSFTPQISNWSRYYGKSSMTEYALSLSYKLRQQIEVGGGLASMRTKGQAFNLYHGQSVGDLVYELNPVNIFILARGVITDDQWLVPYIGAGFTRIYYREQVPEQAVIRGSADGYHARVGLQLSMNNLDYTAANRMFLDYGVYQTFFFIEAEYSRAVERSSSINIGGTSYRAGLLFDF